MSERPGLERLYLDAAGAIASGSKSFAFATRFFPPELARAAHAVYWFCRTTDDMVDEAPSVEQARADLDAWEGNLRDALEGRHVADARLRLFAGVVESFAIPHEYPLELIAGCRMDLTQSRYATFDELRVFCYRVASTVGLMMTHVIGFEGQPQERAIELGIAMQLTNILRDVGEDYGRGRVYLPQDEMERFGYTESDLAAATRNEKWRNLMRFNAERARKYYRSGLLGLPSLHARGRFAVEIAAKVYSQILPRIEAANYDVFHRRAYVPASQKYWITARTLCSNAVSVSLPWQR
ncbi:MAG: phytoene/squalene synthase family protein [Bryobacterales bacterium]|nr:phytoene/squalene synthase family protein [Bryobacterales bacterium]